MDVQRLLGAVTVLISVTAPASAAISTAPAETGSMMLIGAGLILGATLTRVKTRRN